MKTALIVGITGQDGAYLAELLLAKNYRVVGASRDATRIGSEGLRGLGVQDRIEMISLAPSDFRSVAAALKKVVPDEIYYLAGQSSPGVSFDQPVETFESITIACLNFLEAIRLIELDCRFYNAASSEIFGETLEPANEHTRLNPSSPYAVAKAAAFWQVKLYREAYRMKACSGILFNHESPFRPERFVTMKIARAAAEIAGGSKRKLVLGNLQISRDWGWAPEYVDAMWRIMQCERMTDIVIATGRAFSLQDFLEAAFDEVALDWREYVTVDEKFFRPSDPKIIVGDPTKAAQELGWRATIQAPAVARRLVREALRKIPTNDGQN